MAQNNTELLIRKIKFLKYMGEKIEVYYNIMSPNMIVKHNNNILLFQSQKEMNYYINNLIETHKKQIEEEILNDKGVFDNEL